MDGIQVNAEYFDAEKIINQNTHFIKERADEKKVVINHQYFEGGATVYADPAMIDTVVRNLLQNALKFSKPGGTITITAEKKDGVAIISVADTGTGIPAENQHKIFNKFSSYTTYGTAREKGSGLGLLLCKELIEKNNGSIWFTSTPGNGSTFYFTVPLHNPGN
jgi:signal transduction histidine kinase